jgi:hypothetical protein
MNEIVPEGRKPRMNASAPPAFLSLALARPARKTVTVNAGGHPLSRVFPSQRARFMEPPQPVI